MIHNQLIPKVCVILKSVKPFKAFCYEDVYADDFPKLNEFAESAWMCRDPGNSDQIKENKRKLLHKHNSELIKKIDQKKI